MGKILSQSGISLADVYDVEGSIVGVDQLVTEEVQLVHEMGATIMAERLQSFFVRLQVTPSQGAGWTLSSGQLPDCANRVLGAGVFIPLANTTDISHASLSIQNPVISREMPFWTWDASIGDDEVDMRWNDDGAGIANVKVLRSQVVTTPTLITRVGVSRNMPVIRFSGETTAFGAGTVTVTAIVHLIRPTPSVVAPGEPSSHGLPIPGW